MVLYPLPSSLQILILYHKKLQNVDAWKAKQKLLYAIQECTINKSRDLIYIITIFHSTEVWYTRCEPLPSLVDIIKCDVGHSFQYLDLEFPCRLGLWEGPCAEVIVVHVTGYSLIWEIWASSCYRAPSSLAPHSCFSKDAAHSSLSGMVEAQGKQGEYYRLATQYDWSLVEGCSGSVKTLCCHLTHGMHW